ncbi:MAG: enoyl-CoA hydratase/isomerase family protein, partial [Promethearchaeota archaeon]
YSGIFPGTGCVILFSKIIGIPWTKKMLMFGEKISAIKALEIGLIDQVVETKDQLIEETMKKARFLFSKNQTVLQAIKLCSNHFLDKSYTEAYEIEKVASGWYEHEDKENFIRELRKKFE